MVAGRVFWEANMFKPNMSSFTTSGFFVQKDYREPLLSELSKSVVTELVVTAVVLIILILLGLYCYFRN